nr:5'-3' exoribonuclease 2-like [Dermacentor andersoni]
MGALLLPSGDENKSPIIDFYPKNFSIDANGHKWNRQGVALLPFVEERRLLEVIRVVYPLLDTNESDRNTEGDVLLYVREGQPGYDYITDLYDAYDDYDEEFELEPQYFSGIGGKILLSQNVVPKGSDMASPVDGVDPIRDCAVTW